jgi:hypothetical protein
MHLIPISTFRLMVPVALVFGLTIAIAGFAMQRKKKAGIPPPYPERVVLIVVLLAGCLLVAMGS